MKKKPVRLLAWALMGLLLWSSTALGEAPATPALGVREKLPNDLLLLFSQQ